MIFNRFSGLTNFILLTCIIGLSFGFHSSTPAVEAKQTATVLVEEAKTPLEEVVSAKSEPTPKPTIEETGMATWYDYKSEKVKTASGELFKTNELTAAHKSLPFGTIVLVEPVGSSGFNTIQVRINDRLPQDSPNIIDLSRNSALAMSPKMISKGVQKVKLTVLQK